MVDQRAYGPGPGEKRTTAKPVSREEKRERLEFIEKLLVQGIDGLAIAHAMATEFAMGKSLVAKYITEIRARWAEEERGNRGHYKLTAIRRIHGHIHEARKAKNWMAIANFERLLSDIQGTKEPVEVQLNIDATVSEAMIHVVGNLTPEKRRALIEEQRRLRALSAITAEALPGHKKN